MKISKNWWPENQSVFQRNEKDMFQIFGVGHIANVNKKEKASQEQYKMFSKKIWIWPRVQWKNNCSELGSDSVEPQVVDETPAVDESQTVDGSELKTTESTQEAVKTHLNVGAHAT